MGSTILLIHSDPKVRAKLRAVLLDAGFEVAETGERVPVRDAVAALRPDAILLHLTAAEPAGVTVAQLRRHEATRHCRVLVMANRPNMGAAFALLEQGADDCIGLPCDDAELIARLHASLRRAAGTSALDLLRAGPLLLDKRAHRVLIEGAPLELAPAEFRLLTFLLENPGRVFSRTELLRRAWPRKTTAGPRTVDANVRRLRQALERFGCEGLVQTVRGFGYRLAHSRSMTGADAHAASVQGHRDGPCDAHS